MLVPIVCRAIKLPAIVGYILAGIAIGNNGLGWVNNSETITNLAQIGMLYLMFTSGIEIDLGDFRRSRIQSIIFGLLTFSIPCLLGLFVNHLFLHFSWTTSLLLGAMYGSHTLMTYPIVSRYGLQRQNIVSIIIGGTMLATLISLLCLGAISSASQGETGISATLKMIGYLFLFLLLVCIVFPRLASWFIKRNNDSATEFLLVFTLVAVSAWLADLAGLQAILGAFIAGVALNARIPALSPLMNRISFVGNAFLIPIFLVCVGMMIDINVFFSGWITLTIAAAMILTKLVGKWLAALTLQKVIKGDAARRILTFGLSYGSAAGTLAVATIGYNLALLPVEALNAAVLLILVSCLIASFATEHAARQIAMAEQSGEQTAYTPLKVLVTLSNPTSVSDLVDIALFTSPNNTKSLFTALTIIDNEHNKQKAQEMVKHAVQHASASDRPMTMLTHEAANTANGILDMKNKELFNRIVLGMNRQSDNSLGSVAQHLIHSTTEQIMLYRQFQPLNTIERLRVAIPKYAEQEAGFTHTFDSIRCLAIQTSARVTFYCNKAAERLLRQLCSIEKKKLTATFVEMEDWDDSLMIAKDMEENDMLIMLLARPATISYTPLFESTPYLLNKFYQVYNVLIIYPEQDGTDHNDSILQDHLSTTENISLTRRIFNYWLTIIRHKQKYLQ